MSETREATWTETTVPVGPWSRSGRSFREGEPPHREAGEVHTFLSPIWADFDRTVPLAVNDTDGCWALVVAPDSLDAAWAEAEAALPEGWVLELASPNPHEPRPTCRAEAWNGDGGVVRGFVKADDLTPTAALLALAANLREVRE